jgi:hypothetical protein
VDGMGVGSAAARGRATVGGVRLAGKAWLDWAGLQWGVHGQLNSHSGTHRCMSPPHSSLYLASNSASPLIILCAQSNPLHKLLPAASTCRRL